MSRLQELLQQAEDNRIKLSGAIHIEKIKLLESDFRTRFICSSNALEGNSLTISETKMLLEGDKPNDGKPLKDSCEVFGHGDAYDYMIDFAGQQNREITEEFIIELHRIMYERVNAEEAGQYRSEQVHGTTLDYIPPPPNEIPRFMAHLTEQIRSSSHILHPIELAAMILKRLVDIHPFMEGNGKVARLLMNVVLIRAGCGVVSIPLKRKEDYMNALSVSRKQKDMDVFSKWMAECIIEAGEEDCKLLNI